MELSPPLAIGLYKARSSTTYLLDLRQGKWRSLTLRTATDCYKHHTGRWSTLRQRMAHFWSICGIWIPRRTSTYHLGPNEIELNLGQHGFAASGTVHRELLRIWREVVLNQPSSDNTEPAWQSVFQVNISSVYVACRSKQLLGSNTNFHLAKHHYTPASSDRRRCGIGTEVTRSRRSSRSFGLPPLGSSSHHHHYSEGCRIGYTARDLHTVHWSGYCALLLVCQPTST